LVSSPDAKVVAVFYETGRAVLYKSSFGQGGWPEQLEPLAEFGFHLPAFEDPVAAWNGDALWYQATPGTLASVSAERTEPCEEEFPAGHRGELSALVFSGDMYLLALRHGEDTILLNGCGSSMRREAAQVVAACASSSETVAVAFSDGTLVLFGVGAILSAKTEIRVGMVRGSLGWDGTRLLWEGESAGPMAWDIAEPAPRRLQDGQAVFPQNLHVIPRQWFARSDGSMLLATTHSLVDCQVSDGGVAFEGRIESLHGGRIWRAIWKRDTEAWLLARYRRGLMLGRGDRGWIHFDLDGQGRVLAANSSGEGGIVDPRTNQHAVFQNCPPGINMIVGDKRGGAWLTDRSGNIYFLDALGQCTPAATPDRADVSGSQLVDCGSHLVWAGYSSKFFVGTGIERARTLIFYTKGGIGDRRLKRLGEQIRHPKEGVCVVLRYDPNMDKIATIWSLGEHGVSYWLRIGTVDEYIRWQCQEIKVQGLGDFTVVQGALSANGRYLAITNRAGELSYVSLADGRVTTTLCGSSPFTMIAPGAEGSEVWLAEDNSRIYKCTLVEGRL
jgi:hypothetical protein